MKYELRVENGELRNMKGFTIIELLISLLILTTVTGTLVGVFVVSLRSTKKISNIQLIRQNGNYAVNQMKKMIQYAEFFNGISTDNVSYTKTCDSPTAPSLTQYKYVKVTALDGGQTTFSCSGSPQTIASNSASLIDTSVFFMSACSFTCIQAATDTPYTIGISFTIDKINRTSFLEDPTPLIFQSSVTLRNVK